MSRIARIISVFLAGVLSFFVARWQSQDAAKQATDRVIPPWGRSGDDTISVNDVARMTIWGNHSATQYPDVFHATVKGQSAFEAAAAVLAALFEAHIHDLEGHILGAVVAHERSGLQIPHANREFQLDLRAGREMAADGRNAAAEARRFDFQRKIFFQIDTHGTDRFAQSNARMTPLTHKF